MSRLFIVVVLRGNTPYILYTNTDVWYGPKYRYKYGFWDNAKFCLNNLPIMGIAAEFIVHRRITVLLHGLCKSKKKKIFNLVQRFQKHGSL